MTATATAGTAPTTATPAATTAAAGGDRARSLHAAIVGYVLVGAVACAVEPAAGPVRSDTAATVADTVPAPAVAHAAPTGLRIPAIDVDTELLTLGLNPDGTVQVPPLESPLAGWYEHSPSPGELGPSVILGHVDSARSGPGVFTNLAALRVGDLVEVARADGSTVAFRVDRVEHYPKAEFPTAAVYGDIDHAGLRLITCGGRFDRNARSYEDNVVAYASAVQPENLG